MRVIVCGGRDYHDYEKIIKALEQSDANETTLFLELSFRERFPYDNNVIRDLKDSIEYWRPYTTI